MMDSKTRSRRRVWWAVLFSAGVAAFDAGAVGTRYFTLASGEDYKGGDLTGVAVDSSGKVRAGLTLGSIEIEQASTTWAALPMPDGSLLIGTGNEGKLFELRGATPKVVAETKALVVTSLARAWGGSVVLGTLPDGKVFKWERNKLSELVSLKDTEHVWQVAFDAKTNSVYAATGPEGKLFRITADGQAQVYFDAKEQHLMSVAVAADGTVYAGSSDKAKLYKITGPGRASVLYDFGRTEVRAIAVDGSGGVYAIANEIKGGTKAPQRKTGSSSSGSSKSSSSKIKGKGVLYYFSPNGEPEELYDEKEEHFVSLALGDDGRPYVGTGVEGRVYTVDAEHNTVLVADTEERQIGALLLSGPQKIVLGSDPAVVHPVRGQGGPDALWTSKVLDAGIRASFGKLDWDATGTLEFSTRTGNTEEPDDTWSAWSAPMVAPSPVASPAARYLQIRARWNRDPKAVLGELRVAFVTDNLRAVVTEVQSSAGAMKTTKGSSLIEGVEASGGPITDKADTKVELKWKVDNPDKDELRYRLQYRLVGSNTWYDLLKPSEQLTSENYSWDTSDLPEGRYRIRVSASDELSNPPDRVKRHQLESGIVIVDNTPPVIEGLRTAGRRVRGTAIDGVGPIQRIEVALAGSDEWRPFAPADGIFDEQREEFDIDVTPLAAHSQSLIVIRVYDSANNYVVRNLILK